MAASRFLSGKGEAAWAGSAQAATSGKSQNRRLCDTTRDYGNNRFMGLIDPLAETRAKKVSVPAVQGRVMRCADPSRPDLRAYDGGDV